MDRYSFLVRILPPLLHAGLSRRTNIAIKRNLIDVFLVLSDKPVHRKSKPDSQPLNLRNLRPRGSLRYLVLTGLRS